MIQPFQRRTIQNEFKFIEIKFEILLKILNQLYKSVIATFLTEKNFLFRFLFYTAIKKISWPERKKKFFYLFFKFYHVHYSDRKNNFCMYFSNFISRRYGKVFLQATRKTLRSLLRILYCFYFAGFIIIFSND